MLLKRTDALLVYSSVNRCVDWSPGGASLLVTGSDDGTARLWDIGVTPAVCPYQQAADKLEVVAEATRKPPVDRAITEHVFGPENLGPEDPVNLLQVYHLQ